MDAEIVGISRSLSVNVYLVVHKPISILETLRGKNEAMHSRRERSGGEFLLQWRAIEIGAGDGPANRFARQ